MPKYEYPFVECDHHPGPQRAYVICKHILYEGAAVADVDPIAEDNVIGAIVCAKKHNNVAEELALICEGCAIEHGHIPGDSKRKATIRRMKPEFNPPKI